MYTLNQIVKDFRDIATAHKQINFFDYGLLENIASSGDITYPYLYVASDRDPIKNTKSIIFNFTGVLSDLSHKGQINSLEIESDCIQIVNDICSLLQHPDYPFKFIADNIRLELFRDKYVDEVTGVLFDFSIEVPVDMDRCAVPGQSVINSNPACAPVTIYNENGSIAATVASGGRYDLTDCPTVSLDTFLNFVFGIGATADYSTTIVSGEEGTYTANTLTNLTSPVYRVNGNITALPLTLVATDILRVTGTITSAAAEARVKLTGTYV